MPIVGQGHTCRSNIKVMGPRSRSWKLKCQNCVRNTIPTVFFILGRVIDHKVKSQGHGIWKFRSLYINNISPTVQRIFFMLGKVIDQWRSEDNAYWRSRSRSWKLKFRNSCIHNNIPTVEWMFLILDSAIDHGQRDHCLRIMSIED